MYNHCALTFQRIFHTIPVHFLQVAWKMIYHKLINKIQFLIHNDDMQYLTKELLVGSLFEQLKKQCIYIPNCYINHVIQIVVFRWCCYLGSVLIPRYCAFKSFPQVFWKLNVNTYRQSDKWNITFSASNHEIYSCYVIILHQ